MKWPISVVFMGSDVIGLPLLQYLHRVVRLVGIFSQPDRPSGRGKKIRKGPISTWVREQNLPLLQPDKLGEPEMVWLRKQSIDLLVVMAYGHILKKELLNIPALGAFNLHASLLPAYRGASPVEGAVAMGERETGVCLMQMVSQLDAGPVLDRTIVPIKEEETAVQVKEKLAKATVWLFERNLPKMVSGQIACTAQEEVRATFTRKLKKEDGQLDFLAPAAVLAARWRALYPWPGVYFDIRGTRIKVGSARADPTIEESFPPGTILGEKEGFLLVTTGKGQLKIGHLQRPGGKMLPVPEFLRGFSIALHTKIDSGSMSSLVSEKPFPYKMKKCLS